MKPSVKVLQGVKNPPWFYPHFYAGTKGEISFECYAILLSDCWGAAQTFLLQILEAM